jgi:hypothetical protein
MQRPLPPRIAARHGSALQELRSHPAAGYRYQNVADTRADMAKAEKAPE